MFEGVSMARAMETSCRWPWDRLEPKKSHKLVMVTPGVAPKKSVVGGLTDRRSITGVDDCLPPSLMRASSLPGMLEMWSFSRA